MEALTIEKLKKLSSGEIIDSGKITNKKIYSGGRLKWVAYKSETNFKHAWMIKFNHYKLSDDNIYRYGQILKKEYKKIIKELVSCTDEVFEFYNNYKEIKI